MKELEAARYDALFKLPQSARIGKERKVAHIGYGRAQEPIQNNARTTQGVRDERGRIMSAHIGRGRASSEEWWTMRAKCSDAAAVDLKLEREDGGGWA
jgi:hypothetical protein